jgi:hypothetical protein
MRWETIRGEMNDEKENKGPRFPGQSEKERE